MWITHWPQGPTRKNLPPGLLLAKGSFRYNRMCIELRQLSEVCKGSKTIFVYDLVDTTNMALAKVGNGHNWLIASCPGELKICSCSSGIFFKMDQRKILGNDNFSDYSEVF
jgi:hypothetical protein